VIADSLETSNAPMRDFTRRARQIADAGHQSGDLRMRFMWTKKCRQGKQVEVTGNERDRSCR